MRIRTHFMDLGRLPRGDDVCKQVGFIQGKEEYGRVFQEEEIKFARSPSNTQCGPVSSSVLLDHGVEYVGTWNMQAWWTVPTLDPWVWQRGHLESVIINAR